MLTAIGKFLLYTSLFLLCVAWLVTFVGLEKSGLSILIGIWASIVLLPSALVGGLLIAWGRSVERKNKWEMLIVIGKFLICTSLSLPCAVQLLLFSRLGSGFLTLLIPIGNWASIALEPSVLVGGIFIAWGRAIAEEL